jgi:hypothetical protein
MVCIIESDFENYMEMNSWDWCWELDLAFCSTQLSTSVPSFTCYACILVILGTQDLGSHVKSQLPCSQWLRLHILTSSDLGFTTLDHVWMAFGSKGSMYGHTYKFSKPRQVYRFIDFYPLVWNFILHYILCQGESGSMFMCDCYILIRTLHMYLHPRAPMLCICTRSWITSMYSIKIQSISWKVLNKWIFDRVTFDTIH